ncbi:MAG TPA: phosphoserine phosphatase SerB [Streptosporangiaceae bacterium]|jgi:phosphoserine phosphatase
MNVPQTTLLVTLTGRDRPGVTARLFAALARHDLAVLDAEQVVIRGRLVLGVLLGCAGPPDLTAIHRAVTALAADLGLEAEITAGRGDEPRRRGRLHVTVLGRPLTPSAVAAIAGQVAAAGANIDRIGRLAQRPVTCIELDVSGAEPGALRAALAAEATRQQVDVAVQPGGLHRRAMRLVVMDVDSTLVQDEVIDLLAARAGCADRVASLTAAAMHGELDFTAALRDRVALLAGLDHRVLDEVRAGLRLAPGARTLITTLRRLGYRCGIVSGGFIQVIEPLAAELGIDYVAANTLEISDGMLTGRLTGPVIDRPAKAAALHQFARQAGVPVSQAVAVGDGANDLDMIAAAGLGVAFNAKQVVRDAADAAVSVPYLDSILYLLGISREDVEAADAAAEDTAQDAAGVTPAPASPAGAGLSSGTG